MNLETAPKHDEGEDEECAICDGENTFVLYENDKVCKQCGHAPTSTDRPSDNTETEWSRWEQHRREEYSGFYGDERIKFVGGFTSAYQFEKDF